MGLVPQKYTLGKIQNKNYFIYLKYFILVNLGANLHYPGSGIDLNCGITNTAHDVNWLLRQLIIMAIVTNSVPRPLHKN